MTGTELVRISNIRVTLAVKTISDSGTATANSADSGGTVVTFNKTFINIDKLEVSAKATSAIIATYDFTDTPNPTQFTVYLWDKDGNRVSGDFSWSAEGI